MNPLDPSMPHMNPAHPFWDDESGWEDISEEDAKKWLKEFDDDMARSENEMKLANQRAIERLKRKSDE
jgi:hypothetical protein